MPRQINVPAMIIAGVAGLCVSATAGWSLGSYAAGGIDPHYSTGYEMPAVASDSRDIFDPGEAIPGLGQAVSYAPGDGGLAQPTTL